MWSSSCSMNGKRVGREQKHSELGGQTAGNLAEIRSSKVEGKKRISHIPSNSEKCSIASYRLSIVSLPMKYQGRKVILHPP